MKLKEQKRILYFLKSLLTNIQGIEDEVSLELLSFFSEDELIEIVLWLYPKLYNKKALDNLTREQIVSLINSEYNLLVYIIEDWEKKMTSKPTYSQIEIDDFFARTQNEIHYLATKPVLAWDNYDYANYKSLMKKTGTTKKVYAIFTSDVLAEDVYAVTTKPSYFFDTEEEAETEITNIVAEGKFTTDDLVVHSLWLLT